MMTVGYYFWVGVYFILGTLSIGPPLFAALALLDGKVNQVLAGCGALAAVSSGF